MTLVTGTTPFDADYILSGAVRIAYAVPGTGTVPVGSAAVPTSLSDIMDLSAPYALKAGWKYIGATTENPNYTRSFETEGVEIQEYKGNLFEEVTEVSRTMEFTAAEFREEILRIVESAGPATTVAAAAGSSAQKVIKFGSFESPDRYRWVFVAQRPKTSTNAVTEPSGKTRGPFVACVLYQGSISADDAQMEFGKGQVAAAGVTIQGFPEGGLSGEVAAGAWFLESPGTILSA